MKSTCDLLIVGRNQLLYLEKLKKHGIAISSIKKIDDKQIILRLSKKDVDKAIELAGNMWYNKILGYSGFYRLFRLVKNNLIIILATILFAISLVYFNNIIFEIDYSGVPIDKRKTVEQIVKSQSIRPLSSFNDVNKSELKRQAAANGLSFFETEKVGFILKINAKSSGDKHSKLQSYDKIVAPYNCKIASIVVFSGTALKSVGDTVCINETIVDGKATINEKEYTVKAIAQILVERTYVEEFQVPSSNEETINECIAMARLQIFGEECSSSVQITPIGEQFIVKVELKVLCLLNGG